MHQRTNRNRRFLFAATGILLLAAGFRLVALQDLPPGLSQDEVFNAGMPAHILAGNFELFFPQAYGHEPLYHYLTIPFYWLFGENYLEVRLLSAFLGLLLVAMTMRWARRDFGRITAIVAGLGLAVSWTAVIFSRIGIRAIMQPILWVAAAWFWRKRPWLAGLFLGLSLYTYTSAQVAFAIPIIFSVTQIIVGKDRAARIMALKNGGVTLGVAILVSLPLYFTWWADPDLLQRVDQLSGPLQALRQGDVLPILKAILNTLGFFSFTGDPRWTYSLPGRPLLDLVTAVLFYVGIIMALWRIRRPTYSLLLTIFLVGLTPSMLTAQSPSSIRLLGALPAVFILIGLPVTWMIGNLTKARRRWRPAIILALVLLLLLNISRTVQTGLAWANAQETRLDHYQTVLLEIGRHWQDHPTENAILAESYYEQIDADSLRRIMGDDRQARWVQAGPEVAGAIVFPGGTGSGRIYVPEFSPLNPSLLIEVGIGNEPVFRSDTIPSFAIYELPEKLPEPTVSAAVTFDGRIRLEGYTLLPPDSEGNMSLFTYWRVLQPLPWNLTAFAHLLDSQGNLVSQYDGLDAAPGQLIPGDLFVQAHRLQAPLKKGPFSLRLGLYTPDNGDRLPIAGESSDSYVLEEGLSFSGDQVGP